MRANVRVGELLYLFEPDYRYGVGRLWLRVREVLGDDPTDVEWVRLKGEQLNWQGKRIGEFKFSVRKKALEDPRAHGRTE